MFLALYRSQHVADLAGLDETTLQHEEIEVRGRKEPMRILVLDDAKQLKDLARSATRVTEEIVT